MKLGNKNTFGKICTACGACCTMVGKLPESSFPKEFVKEDGSCINLQPDMKCAIYAKRPLICDVDRMYYVHTKGQMPKQSKQVYYEMQKRACITLQNIKNVPQERRMK